MGPRTLLGGGGEQQSWLFRDQVYLFLFFWMFLY